MRCLLHGACFSLKELMECPIWGYITTKIINEAETSKTTVRFKLQRIKAYLTHYVFEPLINCFFICELNLIL